MKTALAKAQNKSQNNLGEGSFGYPLDEAVATVADLHEIYAKLSHSHKMQSQPLEELHRLV